jgi:hypothetical protein
MARNHGYWRVLIFLLWTGLAAAEEAMTPEQLEEWFNSDADDTARALAVNEGELVFLAVPPAKAVHHLRNRITIKLASLDDGFVELYQCHDHLDAVHEAQVVYRYHRLRNLRIDSQRGIDKVWVEGDTVQMVDIGKDAGLCIRAEVGILYANGDGSYVLRNGPFHRRFLDGYYPMHVTLEIHYPPTLLQFDAITPAEQPGFHLMRTPEGLTVEAWFEGMLTTEARFVPAMICSDC